MAESKTIVLPVTRRDRRVAAALSVPAIDRDRLPKHLDRASLAVVITALYGPTSRRSLERWPLAWRRMNNCAVAETELALAEAERRFNAMPTIRSGGTVAPVVSK